MLNQAATVAEQPFLLTYTLYPLMPASGDYSKKLESLDRSGRKGGIIEDMKLYLNWNLHQPLASLSPHWNIR